MSCSSCKYLKEKDKKKGCVSGCKYYCSKIKTYTLGNNPSCPKYEKSYCRKNFECDLIYEEGENFYDDSTSISFYIIVLIVLLILALIVNF